MRFFSLTLFVFLVVYKPAYSAQLAVSESVFLEELTWPEVTARMTRGSHTIIIPTGGTEQNGPHLALGKHNWIVKYTAGDIATRLGNALVAPVISYVPEGSISPAQGHMQFPGTISISEEHYAGVLEDTARSFKQHGFKLICFLGDSGGNQEAQLAVAERLNAQWRGSNTTVMHVNAYYENADALSWLHAKQIGGSHPDGHAGFMDTSELLAARPEGVRKEAINVYSPKNSAQTGVAGDPSEATRRYGEALLAMKVAAGLKQIQRVQKHLKLLP